jgi:excisionase family DNA binding protein
MRTVPGKRNARSPMTGVAFAALDAPFSFVESRNSTPDHTSSEPRAREGSIPRTRFDERLVYTVTEAATLLGISRAHGYDLIASGELSHLRLGRRIVVPKRVIEALLDVGVNGDSVSAGRGGEQ